MKRLVSLKAILDKFIETGTGNQCLCAADAAQKKLLPVAVELRQHVVQQKNGLIRYFFFDNGDLR